MIVQTGDGFDSLTIDDIRAALTADLGEGDDTLTIRNSNLSNTDASGSGSGSIEVRIDTGPGSDQVIVHALGANTMVTIETNTSPGDVVDVELDLLDPSSILSIGVSAEDHVFVKTETKFRCTRFASIEFGTSR